MLRSVDFLLNYMDCKWLNLNIGAIWLICFKSNNLAFLDGK